MFMSSEIPPKTTAATVISRMPAVVRVPDDMSAPFREYQITTLSTIRVAAVKAAPGPARRFAVDPGRLYP
jgi:hypothetical protein